MGRCNAQRPGLMQAQHRLLSAEAAEQSPLHLAARCIIKPWKKQETSVEGIDPILGHPQLRTTGSSTPNKHDHSPTALES